MSIFMFIGFWVLGMIAFAMWDAYIGFGVEFDGGSWPPLGLAIPAWPIVLPFVLLAKLIISLASVKERRIKREKERAKLRIATEKELEKTMEQLEREMSYENENQNSRRSRRAI